MVGAICKLWLTVMLQSAVMMLQCLGPLCLQRAVVTAVRVCSLNFNVWLNNNEPFQTCWDNWYWKPNLCTKVGFTDACPLSSDVVSFNCLYFDYNSRYFTSPSFRNSWCSHYCPARPRSPCSRPLVLTVSDATVAWPEPEWFRDSDSHMIDDNGYQLFTAQKIKYWGKNSNKT